MVRVSLFIFLLLLEAPLSKSSFADVDLTNLGGDLTSSDPLEVLLELPAPNIISEERRVFQLLGHGDFHDSFEVVKVNNKTILGPNFNSVSCASCHVKNGKGPIRFGRTGSAMLVKVSLKGLNRDRSPKDVPGIGEQLQDHTIDGKRRFSISLKWKRITGGKYADGSRYELRSPDLNFRIPNVDRRKIVSSLRMTPMVVGVGLLEAIPEDTLRSLADPNDTNRDGISGKLNIVNDKITKSRAIGRFGFKASHPSVKQQSAAAFFHDMGLTNDLFIQRRVQKEVSTLQLDRVTFYLQLAGVPPARDQDNPDVIAGKELFQRANCQSCHVVTIQTGNSPIPELANQEIHPFTDLLLHDMGPGLADQRAEFSASGSEWRTTPLWGIGLNPILSRNGIGYLHDGRARTLEEAILWHGGEAKNSRENFRRMSKTERDQLIAFLNSL